MPGAQPEFWLQNQRIGETIARHGQHWTDLWSLQISRPMYPNVPVNSAWKCCEIPYVHVQLRILIFNHEFPIININVDELWGLLYVWFSCLARFINRFPTVDQSTWHVQNLQFASFCSSTMSKIKQRPQHQKSETAGFSGRTVSTCSTRMIYNTDRNI